VCSTTSNNTTTETKNRQKVEVEHVIAAAGRKATGEQIVIERSLLGYACHTYIPKPGITF
jgi:pyruvate/2-oxoglutarate dehydrogenase complex dihydrolipoamide dehydrogenase (E3) component